MQNVANNPERAQDIDNMIGLLTEARRGVAELMRMAAELAVPEQERAVVPSEASILQTASQAFAAIEGVEDWARRQAAGE